MAPVEPVAIASDEAAMPPAYEARFQANFSSLLNRQPILAALLADCPIGKGVHPATGRDGSQTFLIQEAEGRPRWFGGSSMPGISGVEIITSLELGEQNVVLPGILTGREALTLLERLPEHAAVFVVERNARDLRLALYLHEYDRHIERGRLVFFAADSSFDAQIDECFERYPGYVFPVSMLTPAVCDAAWLAEARRLIEGAGSRVCSRQGALAAAQPAQASIDRSEGTRVRRLAILSTDARPLALAQARALERAADGAGLFCGVCIPDRPDRCHPVARLQAIRECRAEFVLFLNSAPEAAKLPGLGTASWYLPEAVISADDTRPAPAGHVYFASSQTQMDALITMGVSAARVYICPPGAHVGEADGDPLGDSPARAAGDRDPAITMLGDFPDAGATSCGITLTSHVSFWNALTVAAREGVYRSQVPDEEHLLTTAERSSGVTLREPAIRSLFAAMLRTRLLPFVHAHADVHLLTMAGQRMAAVGLNWSTETHRGAVVRWCSPVWTWMPRLPVQGGDVVVIPCMTEATVSMLLTAMGAGIPVVCRFEPGFLEREYPGLQELEPFMHGYQSRDALLAGVRDAAKAAAQERALAASELVRERHSLAARLERVLAVR